MKTFPAIRNATIPPDVPSPAGQPADAPAFLPDLSDLLDRSSLLMFQETITKVTGMSAFFFDANGEPLAAPAIGRPFCRTMRQSGLTPEVCRSADSYGVRQATMHRNTRMYFCSCGLLRAAIPLFARTRYLGTLLCGEIRCNNAPATVPRLGPPAGAGGERETPNKPADFDYEYDILPACDFTYFSSITELIASMAATLAEKALDRLMHATETDARLALLNEQVQRLERELCLKESEAALWKSRLELNFFTNALSSISSLAMIEDSPRTNEMTVLFAEHLRHYLSVDREYVTLEEEIGNVRRYLDMQHIRFGEMLRYGIDLPEHLADRKVPSQVLLPFVEHTVFHGLSAREEGYALSLSVCRDNEDLLVRITDNAAETLLRAAQGGLDCKGMEHRLNAAKRRLDALFSDRSSVKTTPGSEGTEHAIRYPLSFAGEKS